MTTAVSDSYCTTIEEASAILAKRSNYVTWTAASSANKIIALQEATQNINALSLRGERYEAEYIYNGVQKDINSDGLTQTLEFPRWIDGVLLDYDFGTSLPIVPQKVKNACAVEALAIIMFNANSSNSKRQLLQEQGVTSFSMGDLSESFGGKAKVFSSGMKSTVAFGLLKDYIDTTAGVL